MAGSSFVQRQLKIAVTLAADSQAVASKFASAGDTITLPTLRASARIQNSGAPSPCMGRVSVYGMTQSLMNQLSTLGILINLVPRNVLTVSAGDDDNGFATVFTGIVIQAYADYSAAPDVPFHFECQFGADFATRPADVLEYTGSTDVVSIMQTIANKMGVGFENNGVDAKIPTQSFRGSLISQMQEVALTAGITAEVVNGQTLVISPKFRARSGGAIVVAPPPIGQMIDYPAFTPQGVIVRTIFNPQIRFLGEIEVRSSIIKPQTFLVSKLDHALDTQIPHGQWMSTIYGYSPDAPQPILTPP